jgi:hypothetical protein
VEALGVKVCYAFEYTNPRTIAVTDDDNEELDLLPRVGDEVIDPFPDDKGRDEVTFTVTDLTWYLWGDSQHHYPFVMIGLREKPDVSLRPFELETEPIA